MALLKIDILKSTLAKDGMLAIAHPFGYNSQLNDDSYDKPFDCVNKSL